MQSKVAPYVGQNCIVEQDCVLGNDSHPCPEGFLGDVPQVLPVHPDAACRGVVEPEE